MKFHRLALSCFSLCLLASFAGSTAHSQTTVQITKRVTIQPIQIRSTDGVTTVANAAQTLFEAETKKIWAQAGIDVLFLPMATYNDSSYLSVSANALNSNSLAGLVTKSGTPWVSGGSLGLASTVIRLFFAPTIDNDSSVLGFALQSGITNGGFNNVIQQKNGIVISDSAFSFNGGIGRIDVIAHELGHNLGLDHDTQGAGGANNLMSSPRTNTASINDIFPHGNDLDFLTGSIGGTNVGNDNLGAGALSGGLQIDRARAMTNAVNITPFTYTYTAIPEPATASLIAGAVLAGFAGVMRLRRKRSLKLPKHLVGQFGKN